MRLNVPVNSSFRTLKKKEVEEVKDKKHALLILTQQINGFRSPFSDYERGFMHLFEF